MGPYTAQMLGDMGADVIKVEAPGGDSFRHVEPSRSPGMGAPFLNLNRNKRSIVLDVKVDADRSTLLDLIAAADVLITNVRPKSLRKLGLDYATLSDAHPRLVYCCLTGFSQDGPNAERPAFDDIIQAMTGIAALEGVNRGEPAYVNSILADKVTGLMALSAIGMALLERERSGLGQEIEVPMYEVMVSFNLVEHLAAATFPGDHDQPGYNRVLSPHRRPYRTRDGHISLLPYTTAQWVRIFELLGRQDYAADADLLDAARRSRTIDLWYERLGQITPSRTTAEWLSLCEQADVPAGPVQDLADLISDPWLSLGGVVSRSQHPSEGEVRTIGIPVRFSRTPGSIRRLAPRLGEHREEILEEIRRGAIDREPATGRERRAADVANEEAGR